MIDALPPAAPFALFDDSLADSLEANSLLLFDLERIIACHDANELDLTLAGIEAAAASGAHVAVVADYELAYWLEPKAVSRPWTSERPLLAGYVFRVARKLDAGDVATLLAEHRTTLPPARRIAGIAGLRAKLDEDDYLAGVRRILAYIADGDCYQVDYTFSLSFHHYGDPLVLYETLRKRQPVHYGAYLRLPERTLLSLSPELFVERHGDCLRARPMKGTAPRHDDRLQDESSRDQLAASEKDRAENVMIVDLIRNDLGRIARLGSVRVDRLFEVEPYPTLWQMTSTIRAEAPGVSLAGLFRALFPCGSVTGAPKIRAMQIAAELESGPRGVYTGAIGYLRPGGDFRFNVPIRTLCLEADGSGSLGIGSGIVADSLPERELAECRLKSRFVTGIDAGFQLIETLLLEPTNAVPYALLDEHLARLSASAAYFGFACDLDWLRSALLAHGREFTAIPAPRMARLLLEKSGHFSIESAALPVTTADLKLVLAAGKVESTDIFRRHKTTVRHQYDTELKRVTANETAFDAIFCNERGELCEGARSNIYLEIDGVLHTPPETAGLLNGVMRRHLIRRQSPRIVERTLYPSDLHRAKAIYVSNAVRGLRRARLLGTSTPEGGAPAATPMATLA
jgi:para-aminobenzoate synthetase/4-amino-4-deoxychorismate lyase